MDLHFLMLDRVADRSGSLKNGDRLQGQVLLHNCNVEQQVLKV